MFPYAWQLISLFVTLIPLIVGVCVAVRYRQLSPHVPLIVAGFALMALLHVASSGIQIVLTNLMIHHSESGLPVSSYSMMMGVSNGIIMSLNLGAWALVLIGLSQTLRDLQNRLWMRENATSVQPSQIGL